MGPRAGDARLLGSSPTLPMDETEAAAGKGPDEPAERRGPRFRSIDVGCAVGRYQVVEELGMGGMATVYCARDTELRRDVAIKVLFPHLCKRRDIVARFQREARAAAALDHPNIVRVYDVGGGQGDTATGATTDAAADVSGAPGAAGEARSDRLLDPPYIVMELVRGRSLQEFVQAQGEPPLAEVVAGMGMVLCAALAEAHRAGVVHRDVKPANIMVTDSGRLALADFGVARIEDEDSSLVTRTGALLGTPAFMSPEQAMGNELDARSDIFSLGATLYRMATGATPFAGSTARVVTAIATGESVPPLRRNPAMGKELARVIERMMAHQPGARFQSAAEAAEALRRIATRTGLGEPAAELEAFFADPAAYTARRTPEVARATLELSRQAARERALPRAMALADRVLALAPGSQEASEALALVEGLGPGRRRWLLAGSAALAVIAAIAAGAWWAGWPASAPASSLSGDAGPDTAVAAAEDRGSDASTAGASSAAGSGLALASRHDAGAAESRATPSASTAGQGRGSRQGSARSGHSGHSGTARSPDRRVSGRGGQGDGPDPGKDGGQESSAPVPAGQPDAGVATVKAEAKAVRPAALTLDLRPWCDVRINGKDHGRASRDRVITLPPGSHEVVCTQGPGRAEWRRKVTLKPGQRLDLSGSVLAAVRVTIAVKRGDRVVIEGKSHENGATIHVPPSRYRMEVMAGDARVSSGWVSVPVVASCTVRDQPALDCYP